MHALKLVTIAGLILFFSACSNSTPNNTPPSNMAKRGNGQHLATEEQVKHTLMVMAEIKSALDYMTVDRSKTMRLTKAPLLGTKGAQFFGAAIKAGVLDPAICRSLVIPGGADQLADEDSVKSTGMLNVDQCSFCCPKAEELLQVMAKKGHSRVVILCPNSRNWTLFGDKVPIMFSDSAAPELVSLAELKKSYVLTDDAWRDPVELISNQNPFHKVYE